MTPKKALCIHDMSCVGRCSLTVIMPVLSAMGVQAVPLPTAILSSHFGGFGPVAMQDLTDFCNDALEKYRRRNFEFDCVYSGYLSSVQQIDMVKKAFAMSGNGLKLCDPVMADHGKLYSTVTEELINGFKDLCRHSDVITPNPTEALLLLGRDYTNIELTKQEAMQIAEELAKKYTDVLITGVKYSNGEAECVGYCKDKGLFTVKCNYLPVSYPGTGDLFDGCLAAYMLSGENLENACRKAAAFVEKCVKITYEAGTETKYGVHLESVLKYLLNEKE